MNDSKRLKLFKFMTDQIKIGRQIYVVYPLIEESKKDGFKKFRGWIRKYLQTFWD